MPAWFGEAFPAIVAGLATAAVAGLAMLVIHAAKRRRRVRAQADALSQSPDLPAGVEGELLSRLRELTALLAEADVKIEQLTRLTAGESGETGQSPPRNESRAVEVHRLSVQGVSAVDIARRLRMDVGEVELILHLYTPSERGTAC